MCVSESMQFKPVCRSKVQLYTAIEIKTETHKTLILKMVLGQLSIHMGKKFIYSHYV